MASTQEAQSAKSADVRVLTPTVRVNEFGVRAFPPNLGETIAGRTVIVRDWYGENRLDVLGVVISARSGCPCALIFSVPGGFPPREFSLHTTREIEIT